MVIATTTNNVIENINENLHSANLVAETILGFFQMSNISNNSGGRQHKKKRKQLGK